MATVYNKVVQLFFKIGDKEETDEFWFDIYADLLPAEKAEEFSRMIMTFDRIGKVVYRHTLVWPTQYGEAHGLTSEEINGLVKTMFSMKEYGEYSPPPNSPCVIVGRYVFVME